MILAELIDSLRTWGRLGRRIFHLVVIVWLVGEPRAALAPRAVRAVLRAWSRAVRRLRRLQRRLYAVAGSVAQYFRRAADETTVIALIGLLVISLGLAMIYRPAGLLAFGSAMFALAVVPQIWPAFTALRRRRP